MEKVKKGTWVEIENCVLKPEERAPQIPEDTKRTPLMMWIKGFLVEDNAALGDTVMVQTLAGRVAKGTLTAIEPRHEHDYGNPVTELLVVGTEIKSELEHIQEERS